MNLKEKYHYLKIRSLVVQAIRDFFTSREFLEVETPVRCSEIIPEAYIDPVKSEDFYLQASPELCMKQLLSEGFTRIFQICKTFRKGEKGKLHQPEFTLLEWYSVNNSYLDLMDQCREMVKFISKRLGFGDFITYQDQSIHLNKPWQKLSIKKAFELYSDISLKESLNQNSFDEIISSRIEPELGKTTPSFLMDYPASQASLAKLKPDNPEFAQRVELYIAGIELANGFTELIDPVEQQKRFAEENRIRVSNGKDPLPMPDSFLKALEGMPEAAGMALGVDRLAMIFSDAEHIKQVIAGATFE